MPWSALDSTCFTMNRPRPTLRPLTGAFAPRVIGSKMLARASEGMGAPSLWTATAKALPSMLDETVTERDESPWVMAFETRLPTN